jgi:adenylate kinase family enzyme
MVSEEIKKISVIGNACSGKTTLSRKLAQKYQLPLTHVDSIQFLSGMRLRNPEETRKLLIDVSGRESWIIDGLGPLKIIEDRFQKSDLVVFMRFPLWRIYWWCLKRQIRGLFVRRSELPQGCFESTPAQTLKLVSTIWNVHHGMWPQLDRIFKRDIYQHKVVYVRSLADLKTLLQV